MPSSRYSFRRNRFAPEVPTRIPPRAAHGQFEPPIDALSLHRPGLSRWPRKNSAPMLRSHFHAR